MESSPSWIIDIRHRYAKMAHDANCSSEHLIRGRIPARLFNVAITPDPRLKVHNLPSLSCGCLRSSPRYNVILRKSLSGSLSAENGRGGWIEGCGASWMLSSFTIKFDLYLVWFVPTFLGEINSLINIIMGRELPWRRPQRGIGCVWQITTQQKLLQSVHLAPHNGCIYTKLPTHDSMRLFAHFGFSYNIFTRILYLK